MVWTVVDLSGTMTTVLGRLYPLEVISSVFTIVHKLTMSHLTLGNVCYYNPHHFSPIVFVMYRGGLGNLLKFRGSVNPEV